MASNLLKKLSLLVLLLCSMSLLVNAQDSKKRVYKKSSKTKIKREVAKKRVSAKDRAAIKKLFKGVNPKKYRLQFYDERKKRAVYHGKRKVRMNELKQVKRFTNPAEAAGWIVFVVEGDDVIYVLAVGSEKLKSVLGAAKLKRLNAIMAKYK